MKKILFLFFLLISFFLIQSSPNFSFFNPKAVFAETGDIDVDLSQSLVLSDGQSLSAVFDTPASMVNLLIRVIFVGVGLILFAMIVIAGLSMIAGGTTESKDKAKTTMTSALIGFIVIFAAYWILQIIQTLTGANIGF
jgi:hypothetical protein